MTYPQQPAPQPYNPPAPKKSKKAAGCLGIGCGGLVLIGIIVGVIAAVGGTKTPATSTGPAAPAATTGKGGAPAPAPAEAKTLLTLKGNGIKNTTRFTTGDNWTINYTYDCTKILGGQGNFTIYVDYPSGDIPVNELGAKGASSSTATGAGPHTMKVASECPWTLTVTG